MKNEKNYVDFHIPNMYTMANLKPIARSFHEA